MRRRIKAGRIRATYDERGRVRILATVSTPSVETDLTPLIHESSSVGRLWEELKAVKSDLERSLAETQLLRRELGEANVQAEDAQRALERFHTETEDIQDELETTRQALEHTQGELTSLWRVMSSRTERQERANRFGVTDGNEAFDLRPGLANLSSERERIQSQISRVRDLSRRRRWPWPQAS